MPKQKKSRKEKMGLLWERLRQSFLEGRKDSGVEVLLEIADELRDNSKQHFYTSLKKVVHSAGRPENADGTSLSHFGFSLLCELRGLEIPPSEWAQECLERLRTNRNPKGARDLLAFMFLN